MLYKDITYEFNEALYRGIRIWDISKMVFIFQIQAINFLMHFRGPKQHFLGRSCKF